MHWVLAAVLAASPEAARLASEAAQLAEAGDLASARQKLEMAQQLSPNDPALVFNLAQLREAVGDVPAAVQAYERYLQLSPFAADKPEVDARLYRLRALAQPVPPEAQQHYAKAKGLLDLRRNAEAEAEAADVVRLAPWWPDARQLYAVAAERLEHFEDAIVRYKVYLPLAPPDDQPGVQARIGELEAKVADRSSRAAEAGRATALKLAGDKDKALATYRGELETAERGRNAGKIFVVAGAAALVGSLFAMLFAGFQDTTLQAGGLENRAAFDSVVGTGNLLNVFTFVGLAATVAGGALGTAFILGNPEPSKPSILGFAPGPGRDGLPALGWVLP